MEDPEHGVFTASDNVIYKAMIPFEMVTEIQSLIHSKEGWLDGAHGLATGIRPYLDLHVRDDIPDLIDHLQIVLRDYFPEMEISDVARYYNHQLGGVKPHRDGNRDGKSTHTLLVYLSDDFEGGRLSIKTPRTEEERITFEPEKFHKVFTLTPRIGYGVIFSKNLLHWASDVLDGHKNFLLLHLYVHPY